MPLVHFNLSKETGVQLDKKQRYEHVPKSVLTNQGGKVTILWNQQVHTDRTIVNTAGSANVKYKRTNARTRNRGTLNNKDRIDATVYPLGTGFVWGICVCGYRA
jgi:hypothetical protein